MLILVWCKVYFYYKEKGVVMIWVYIVMCNVFFDMFRKMKSSKEECISEDIWFLIDEV